MGFSVSQGVSSVTSPSYTSFVSLIRSPEGRQHYSHTHMQSTELRTQLGLYIPSSTKPPRPSVYWTMRFITGREHVCACPWNVWGTVLCKTITFLFLFHPACGPEYEQHAGGWSSVMGVRERGLSQGLYVKVLLSTGWWQPSNETHSPCGSCSRGGAKVLMTTSPLYLSSISSPATGIISSQTNPSPPSQAFLPSQHHSHKSAVVSVAFQLRRMVWAGHLALSAQGLLTDGLSAHTQGNFTPTDARITGIRKSEELCFSLHLKHN